MKEKPNSTHITLWANRSIALILTVLLFALHPILDWYCTVRTLTVHERGAITVAFYICAVIVFFALWQMEKLLKNLLAKQVFLRENVSRVRRVRWCCAGVSLVCLPAALIYKHCKTRTSALIGLITGALSLAAVGGLMNYFVMVPLYAELYMPMETIIGMASAIFPSIDTLWKMILLCVVPFNLIKGALCGIITFLLYKKLAILLKK